MQIVVVAVDSKSLRIYIKCLVLRVYIKVYVMIPARYCDTETNILPSHIVKDASLLFPVGVNQFYGYWPWYLY